MKKIKTCEEKLQELVQYTTDRAELKRKDVVDYLKSLHERVGKELSRLEADKKEAPATWMSGELCCIQDAARANEAMQELRSLEEQLKVLAFLSKK